MDAVNDVVTEEQKNRAKRPVYCSKRPAILFGMVVAGFTSDHIIDQLVEYWEYDQGGEGTNREFIEWVQTYVDGYVD